MIEIIVGIIVLILAIIGIAKVVDMKSGGGEGGSKSRENIPKIDVNATFNDAVQTLYALYNLANTKPEYGRNIAKNVLQYVGAHEREFKYAIKTLGQKETTVYKWLEDVRKKYEKTFDEQIARPAMEKISKYRDQEKVIETALNESKLIGASWYAAFANVIPPEVAQRESKKVIQHYQNEYQVQKTAATRMAQVREFA